MVLVLAVCGCGLIRDPDWIVVARIGKDKFTLGELDRHIAHMPFEQRVHLQTRDKRLEVLDQIIDRRLLLAEADRLGIVATQDEMVATFRTMLQAQGDERAQSATDEQLEAMLESDEIRMPSADVLKEYDLGDEDIERMRAEQRQKQQELRARVEEETRFRKLFARHVDSPVQVTEQEARDYYNANTERLKMPESVRFRYMTFTDEADAKAVLAKVEAGTAFEQLVQETADATEGRQAQELPLYFPVSSLPEDIRQPLAEAEPGVVVGPLRRAGRPGGFDLVQVIEHKPETLMPFDQVKDRIFAQVRLAKTQSAVADYVAELREKYNVRVYANRMRETPRFETSGAHAH